MIDLLVLWSLAGLVLIFCLGDRDNKADFDKRYSKVVESEKNIAIILGGPIVYLIGLYCYCADIIERMKRKKVVRLEREEYKRIHNKNEIIVQRARNVSSY